MRTKNKSLLELQFLTVPLICEPLSGQPISYAVERYPHLSNLELADPVNHSSDNMEINVLIGSDQYWQVVTGNILRGVSGPTAIKTRFGWVLSGPAEGTVNDSTTINLVQSSHVLHLNVSSNQCNDTNLDSVLKRSWDLESLGIVSDEPSVYEKFMEGIIFNNMRYEVRLPWKDEHTILPDNYELSETRLRGLLRRLKQDPQVLKEYDTVIREQINNGIVEVVEEPWNSEIGRTHYIPHHPIIRRDKSTTKLRIVYDASARSGGPSLNDCLYTGPNFGQSILEILLRFRIHSIALIGDIEKAFLMVSVAAQDRDVLRFLWIQDITKDLPRVVVLRFTRVMFGVSASPFLLNATLKHHIEKYRKEDPSFVDTFTRSLYVDDITYGANDDVEAYKLYSKSKYRLATGGFNLRKFVSSSAALQARIDHEEQQFCSQSTVKSLIMEEDQSYTKAILGDTSMHTLTHKVLGIPWEPASDNLLVDISHVSRLAKEVHPTKRNVVSVAAGIYDPLGIISPTTVQLKMFAQKLCKAKIGWDDALTGVLLSSWESLVNNLQQVKALQIPRFYLFGVDRSSIQYGLHGFSDASVGAYAAVVYLKIRTPQETVVRFIASKTRVAPVHSETIPRLELLAALLLARLISTISKALSPEMFLEPPTCYSDSQVALCWIKGQKHEWKQFVQNRVISIRELVPTEQWRYCPGTTNPADIPSRGMRLEELMKSPLWLNGPAWLVEGLENGVLETTMSQECLVEMKNTTASEDETTTLILFVPKLDMVFHCENYSSLTWLLRVTAYVWKFVEVLKAKVKKSGDVSTHLSTEDIARAELYWAKLSQDMLKQDPKFGTWKLQFGLYMDSVGLWRCGGRLTNSDLAESARHPALLHHNHHFTTLVLRDCHKRIMHGGVKETLTEFRSHYWIIKGRAVVKRLLHSCTVCRRFSGKMYCAPPVPPLPEFRVQESVPFSTSGVDFAGPLYLKGVETKVWIALFSCCVTRAVHLELVPDMTTDSFIRCLRRFIARRGVPKKMISDNGKTFKAASKVISAVLQDPGVKCWVAGMHVTWSFNLEKAPWWGGFFERMVRSMKACLKKVIGKMKLSYDELSTVLTEVEATLNSRPLTYVSLEDLDEPLTPSHLLVGHRLKNLPDHSICHDDPEYVPQSSAPVLSKRMKHLSQVLDHFWKRWRREYLAELRDAHQFQTRSNGTHHISVGDVVLIHDDDHPRTFWKLGKVEELISGSDDAIRGALVRIRAGNSHAFVKRPVQRLYPVEVSDVKDTDTTEGTEHHQLPVSNQATAEQEARIRPQRAAAMQAKQKLESWARDLNNSI